MCELGPQAPEEHQRILTWCLDNFPQTELLLIGPQMQQCAHENRITGFTDVASASKHLTRETLAKYKTIYLKGSRSITLETLIPPQTPEYP
jgi:UDP-N-acetylmuramyl pentapeptide synthase